MEPIKRLLSVMVGIFHCNTYLNEFKFFAQSISDIVSPEGIAIDWISRRIYWTDSSKDTIEVASLDDAKSRAVIVQGNLVNPRGIAVDPQQKYIFKKKLSHFLSFHNYFCV